MKASLYERLKFKRHENKVGFAAGRFDGKESKTIWKPSLI